MAQTIEGNLALACRRCNERRYNFVAGIDPETQEIVPIFNPRQQQWAEHFVWTLEGTVIQGSTAVGRATCLRFDLNDMRYPEEDSIRQTRRFWTRTKAASSVNRSTRLIRSPYFQTSSEWIAA